MRWIKIGTVRRQDEKEHVWGFQTGSEKREKYRLVNYCNQQKRLLKDKPSMVRDALSVGEYHHPIEKYNKIANKHGLDFAHIGDFG